MTFGSAIAAARKAKDLSQKELAALVMKEEVIAVKPRGEHVEITAVAEDDAVHTADLAA